MGIVDEERSARLSGLIRILLDMRLSAMKVVREDKIISEVFLGDE